MESANDKGVSARKHADAMKGEKSVWHSARRVSAAALGPSS